MLVHTLYSDKLNRIPVRHYMESTLVDVQKQRELKRERYICHCDLITTGEAELVESFDKIGLCGSPQ